MLTYLVEYSITERSPCATIVYLIGRRRIEAVNDKTARIVARDLKRVFSSRNLLTSSQYKVNIRAMARIDNSDEDYEGIFIRELLTLERAVNVDF